jgi:hypothetical protein
MAEEAIVRDQHARIQQLEGMMWERENRILELKKDVSKKEEATMASTEQLGVLALD